MSDDPAAFLRERLDDRESFAMDVQDPQAELPRWVGQLLEREIAADRRLLAAVDDLAGDIGWDDAIMFAVKCRAIAYSDHPDYRADWQA